MRIPNRPNSDVSIADRIAAEYPKAERKTVAGTVRNLLTEMRRDGVTDPRQQADILGQTALETTMGSDMIEHSAKNAYENRADLGNTKKGDGDRYKGRGYIQITGRASYSYWGHRLGVDLIKHPQLAARPDIAAKITVQGMRDGTFTGMTAAGDLIKGGGKKLSDFFSSTRSDFFGSRQIVNGTDRAGELVQKATTFLANLTKSH